MNQQDELAEIAFEHEWTTNVPGGHYGKCACGHSTPQDCAWYPYDLGNWSQHVAQVVLAAGYSRPRVVETETESGALKALWEMPIGTTIECGSGMLWRKVATGMYGWVGTGVAHHCQPEVFMRDTPLTVLHLPEEKP